MAYSTKTRTIALSLIQLLLGVLSSVLGVVAIKMQEVHENYDGLYGIGIWLGLWMILNTLCGLLVVRVPKVICWISCYVAFCCISMVIMLVCCIPLITGPLVYFSFQLRVSKDYYRRYGPENMYYKPKSYFDERNRIGSIGCGIYGTLLGVILLDIVVTALSCLLWKQALNKLQRERRPIRAQDTSAVNTINFQDSPTPHHVAFIQDGFVINNDFPKLPRYIDLYPDRDPTSLNGPCSRPHESIHQSLPSRDPASAASPPAYSEICNTPNVNTGTDNPPDYDAPQNNTHF